MRYKIENSKIVESIFIDAPYDTKADAKEALKQGIRHNCEKCDYQNCTEVANYSDPLRMN